mmetsp:Transcript_6778/g.11174  ORF Transcript_6778/g.11174 Transcript_6778/m.11174 type:complete len:201 (-) Transcript_6778:7846-8448(-)
MSHDGDLLESALGKFPCVAIQGCPRECTAGDIIMFFSEWKPIDIIFKEFSGQINANAFILFANINDYNAALKKDRENMGKRYIVVKPASRMEYYEAAAARLDSERLPPSHTYAVVKMRGLPFNVTFEDIILFFSEFTLTKPYIKIACRQDGRLTGEAYIRFDTMARAQEALKYDKKEIGKRYVELFIVDPSEADHVLSIS